MQYRIKLYSGFSSNSFFISEKSWTSVLLKTYFGVKWRIFTTYYRNKSKIWIWLVKTNIYNKWGGVVTRRVFSSANTNIAFPRFLSWKLCFHHRSTLYNIELSIRNVSYTSYIENMSVRHNNNVVLVTSLVDHIDFTFRIKFKNQNMQLAELLCLSKSKSR